MFIAILLIAVQTWKQPRCSLTDEWIINCGTTRQWEYQHYKEMRYQAMKRHGGNISTYDQIKETNLKRLNTVRMIPTV